MAPEHMVGILAIEAVSFGSHHWSTDSFLAELDNTLGRYWVLTQAQKDGIKAVLGYCGCWVVTNEGHITTVASHPDCRGKSLGELLFLHLLGWLQHNAVDLATLEVRVSNLSAQNLYYKYGFEGQGVRPRYYQDNREGALIMTLLDMPASTGLITKNQESLLKRLNTFPQAFQEYS